MFKTTFKGYVPKLKLKGAEATIVEGKAIHSKGDSIRYTLRGEYEGHKTFPKTVSKADFENVYGFDAKEAEGVLIVGKKDGQAHSITHNVGEKDKTGFTPMKGGILTTDEPIGEHLKGDSLNYQSDTVGEPSPASVEPPAPSDTPFPQEPSNENFSAEYEGWSLADLIDARMEAAKEEGIEDWENDSNPNALSGHIQTYIWNHKDFDAEVKEAFLGFGDDEEDEEEEEEKPKEQEFTVVMQEGDKLELTDIEEKEETEEGPKDGDNGEDEENDEKDAEMDKGILMICPSCDETVPEYSSCMACGQQFGSEYEAVSAKVTRPVKEEEKEEPEDEEGMSTLMKVGLGVGALAVGAAILGAEERVAVMWEGKDDNNNGLIYGIEYYGEDGEFSDVEWFRTADQRDAMLLDSDGESDYWAGENAHWRAEEPMGWERNEEHFEKLRRVALTPLHRCNDCGWEGDKATTASWKCPECSSESLSSPMKDREYMNAEDLTSSEFVPFDQITAEIQEEWDETTVPIAADYEPLNEPTNANFSAETSTKQGWEITHFGDKRDTRIAKKDGLSVYIEKLSKNSIQHKREGANWRVTYGRYFDDGSGGRIIPLAELFRTYNDIFPWLNNPPFTIHNHAETVGSPSPSGPSSVPEPAEATGSEPSNEHMEAEWYQCSICNSTSKCLECNQPLEFTKCPSCCKCTETNEAETDNTKLVLGITALGIGIAAVLGKDKLKALFDRFGL